MRNTRSQTGSKRRRAQKVILIPLSDSLATPGTLEIHLKCVFVEDLLLLLEAPLDVKVGNAVPVQTELASLREVLVSSIKIKNL